MAPHSSILACRISWIEEPGGLQFMGLQRVRHDWGTNTFISFVSFVSPSICHEMMGLDAIIFSFWMLSFKPAFSLSFLTFISRLFSSSLLSAIRVVSSAYLRLLIFLLAILILVVLHPVRHHMMYSAYKLNKQGDNIQPWHTPFPIWNQSIVPCLVLTIASWPANRFLRRQVRWSGIPISLTIFQFVVIHRVKGFSID